MMILPWHRQLLLCGVLGLATLLLCGCDGHWEDVEKVTGYKGKARLNPFLAAERVLDVLGHDAHEVKSLAKLPDHSAVMFISGEGSMSEGRARQLLSWAYSGGHLVYSLSGTRPYNDFDTQFGTFLAALLLDDQKDPVLERLGVGVEKRFDTEGLEDVLKGIGDEGKDPDAKKDKKDKKDKKASKPAPANGDQGAAGKKKPKVPLDAKKEDEDGKKDESWLESLQEVKWKGTTYRLSLGGYKQLSIARDLGYGEFSAGPQDAALALHLHHGMGKVTLLAHARPFRNRWLGEHDHARWLAALVGDEPRKEVLFVAATTGSFFGLLWERGWMALVALAVCIVFWLWRQMPRLGPLAEVELDTTRHFASHIGALGEFFWRMKKGALLVNAARDAVWARVHEKHRSLDDGSRQLSDDLAAFIATRSGLPAERVTAAFDAPPPATSHAFVLLMRDLQTIRRAL